MKNTQITKQCTVCGQSYKVKKYRADISKYCSRECWSKRNPPIIKLCPICGNQYKTYDTGQITCSKKCGGKRRSKIYVGKKAPAYKDGNSLERDRARLALPLKGWRDSVYKRDNFICQQCGDGGKIHAHHIKPWSTHDSLRFDIDNGVTLCVSCHGNIHGKDFANRRNKECPACGAITKGRSLTGKGLCHSCAANIWHIKQGHKLSLPPEQVSILNQIISQE